MKTIKSVITTVVIALCAVYYYVALPPVSLAYGEGFLFLGVTVVVAAVIVAWWISGESKYRFGLPLVIVILFFVILIGGGIIGSPIFTSSTMYNQIGKVQEKSFKEDIVEIDTTQIPVVDIELAAKLADKKLGEDLALGSQMEVGKFTNKQQVNGKLLYVAPLEHRDFFKWNSNKMGTTAYVVVSATNPNDVQLIKELDGKEIRLKYLTSAYFSSNLKRHLRSNGYRNVGLTEYSFELDDTGRPYWMVTTYENTTIWGNPEATGVVVCDAQTGECNWYSIQDAPEWVDIIQPESFIIKQIKNYGEYVHGMWNFSEKDKLSMTEHITTVYNEGDCYYYTGMSSVGKDNGTVGFVMVNTRDKSVKMYRMVGATEEAAMRSAEGKVQNMGYTATTPIPLLVSGIPTYFCTLKDNEGLVKQYAMLKIEDYSIVASDTTIMATKRAFINAVNNSGASVDFGNEAYGYTVEGKISRINSNIESGETYYYMVLDDDATKLFLASYTVSEELPITREGDRVKISYVDEANGTINIGSFDNLEFTQKISEGQQKLNEERQNLMDSQDNQIINVNPEANQAEWDSLSDEERAKLLEGIKEDE